MCDVGLLWPIESQGQRSFEVIIRVIFKNLVNNVFESGSFLYCSFGACVCTIVNRITRLVKLFVVEIKGYLKLTEVIMLEHCDQPS